MSDNYATVYRGLKLFREAMLAFIIERLQAVYGDEWWERGVRCCFPEEFIDRVEAQFGRRYGTAIPFVLRPGTGLDEILDIHHCNAVLKHSKNWRNVFAQTFGSDNKQTVWVWLEEIEHLRNAVAHPETGDLRYSDAWRGLDTAERILCVFNEKAADEVAALKRSLLQMDKPYASLTLIEEDAPDEQAFDLDRRRVLLGRDASTCNVVIPTRFSRVSRKHALITWEVEGIFIEDLGSRNGTYVNGKRVRGRQSLAHGQQITLGGPKPVASGKVCQLEFSLAPQAETTEERTSASDSGVSTPNSGGYVS